MTRTLETTAIVTADHTITLKPPDEVPEGRCQVVVTLKNCQSEGKASHRAEYDSGAMARGVHGKSGANL